MVPRSKPPAHGDRLIARRFTMSAPEMKTHRLRGEEAAALDAEDRVSRRRLLQESAVTAGALVLASQVDRKDALAQDDRGTPAPPTTGPVLEFDFPGLEIGVAAYPEIPTGCTVFNFDVDM